MSTENKVTAQQERTDRVYIGVADENIALHVVCEDCRAGLQDVGQVDMEARIAIPYVYSFGCCVCGQKVLCSWQLMVSDEESARGHRDSNERLWEAAVQDTLQ